MRYSEDTLSGWIAPLTKKEEERAENTIRMVRSALDDCSELRTMSIEVFTQGSFANNTNVRTESDVDVVVMLKSTFYSVYPDGINGSYFGFGPGSISFDGFRLLVKTALENKFGISSVKDGNKSIKISENTYHVKADVVPALQYRNYRVLNSFRADSYVEGIKFYAEDGSEIINYPKRHRENGVRKNKETGRQYKALVRIMKHVKNEMVDQKLIDEKKIASFLIECLVWNLPNSTITSYDTWTETVRQAIITLYNAIKEGRHKSWSEVSGMFDLFSPKQKWTEQEVELFLLQAWIYLGYAE